MGKPGLYANGGGLYLQVTDRGASWVYRYMLKEERERWGSVRSRFMAWPRPGRKRWMPGDSAIRASTLSTPGAPLRRKACSLRLKPLPSGNGAETYIKAHRAGWRNLKHAAQWKATLATYAEPIIGMLPVQAIDTALVMTVLEQALQSKEGIEPLWTARPETA